MARAIANAISSGACFRMPSMASLPGLAARTCPARIRAAKIWRQTIASSRAGRRPGNPRTCCWARWA
eukprot:9212071-Lingulodinium_polyedra.AAC.1